MIEKLTENYGTWIDENGIGWTDRSSYLQCEVLGLCGCGIPDETMKYIYENLKRFDNTGKEFEWGDYDDLPYVFFCYWANDKGFAEHGGGVRCSWLTEKGKEVLRDIETVAKELEAEVQH